MFIWVTFVGAAIGIKEKIHIGIDIITNLLPRKMQLIIGILVQLAICYFSYVIIRYGLELVSNTVNQPSPAMGIKMSIVYFGMPLSGVLMIYYSLREIGRIVKE